MCTPLGESLQKLQNEQSNIRAHAADKSSVLPRLGKMAETQQTLHQHIVKLQARWPVTVAGCLDVVLAAHSQRTRYGEGSISLPARSSLEGFAAHFAGLVDWKQRRATMSNWEALPLRGYQKVYAAMDAYASAVTFVDMGLYDTVVKGTECVCTPV